MNVKKKHYRQMDSSDFRYIRAKIRNLNHMINMGLKLKLTDHAYDKINYGNAKNVNIGIIKRLLKDYDVIEYKLILDEDLQDSQITKENVLDERVVLRSKFTVKNHNVVIVLSLTKNLVITSWENNVYDRHSTIDLSKYNLGVVGLHCL